MQRLLGVVSLVEGPRTTPEIELQVTYFHGTVLAADHVVLARWRCGLITVIRPGSHAGVMLLLVDTVQHAALTPLSCVLTAPTVRVYSTRGCGKAIVMLAFESRYHIANVHDFGFEIK